MSKFNDQLEDKYAKKAVSFKPAETVAQSQADQSQGLLGL